MFDNCKLVSLFSIVIPSHSIFSNDISFLNPNIPIDINTMPINTTIISDPIKFFHLLKQLIF